MGAESGDPCIVSTMTGITVAEGGGGGGCGKWGPVYCEHDDGHHSGGRGWGRGVRKVGTRVL